MKKDKFRSIEKHKEGIVKDYFIHHEKNVSSIARKYQGPYSTIRRFIDEQKKVRNQEDIDDEEYFNVDDFTYLDYGYTFQWTETTRMWQVVGKAIKESEEVWVLVPTKQKGAKHFICTEEDNG